MLVDARCSERATAGANGDLATFEVPQELLPFLIGGLPVFLGRAELASAGDEGQVCGDRFVGVDGLVTHGDADIAVPGDDLGDMRRETVEDGVSDEHATEVVWGEVQRDASRIGQPGVASASSSSWATKLPPSDRFSALVRR